MIVEHVGITVSDLDRSINFYTKVFGFKVLRKTDMNAYLYLGTDLLEIVQSPSQVKVDKPTKMEDGVGLITRSIGVSHIGFRVDELTETIARLEELGAEMIVPPFEFEPRIEYTADLNEEKLIRAIRPPKGKTRWRIAMFSDPDGIILEILER